jgi:dihydrofolate reductase
MGIAYLHAVSSVDGYIADDHDEVGPLHDWYFNGDQQLVEDDRAEVHGGASFRVSAASADYVRGLWSRLAALVIGRRQFDLTNGWEGHPPAGDHVVVVSHRPKPTGWHPEAPYHFAGSVEEGIALAKELAGDAVAIDVVPVVFGGGKPYFGNLADGGLLLEDPEVVIQGTGVLHLRYPVRR